MPFQDYSATPANNTTIGDTIYIGPNMARDDVREALQQLAADGKVLYDYANGLVDLATGPAGPAGTVTNNGFWTTLEEQGAVGDGNPLTGAGTDDSAALTAALTAIQAAGGGTLFLARKCYKLAASVTIPHDDNGLNVNGIYSQHPIKIVGTGAHAAGQGTIPEGGSILMWTASTGAARIMAYAQGMLESTGVTYMAREASGNRPFVLDTNTTTHFHRNAFWTPKTAEACDDDVIVFGGTTDTLGNLSTSPFQGYGTVFESNYINGCRSVRLQVYANAIRVLNNNFWNRCGSDDTAAGAAIIIDGDGDGGAPGNYAVGNVIMGNLIEMPGYKYGIDLKAMASQTTIIGNDCYDADAGAIAAVHLGADSQLTSGLPSLAPDGGRPYWDDDAAFGTNQTVESVTGAGLFSKFPSLMAGRSGYPNNFFDTIMFGGDGNVFVAPNAAGFSTQTVWGLREYSADQVASPGAFIHGWKYDGSLSQNDRAGVGNVTRGLATAEQVTNNGRTRTATGRMRVNSTADYIDLWAARVQLAGGDGTGTGALYNGTVQVVGAQQSAPPADATDLATAIALVNSLKTIIRTHGLAA